MSDVLENRKKLIGENSIGTITAKLELAAVHMKIYSTNKNKKSLHKQKADSLYKSIPNNKDFKIYLSRYARELSSLDLDDESIAVRKDILEIVQSMDNATPKEHIDAVDSLAIGYYNASQYENAVMWYKKAHELAIKNYGVDHEITLDFLNSIAQSFNNSKKYKESFETYNLLLEKHLSKYGVKHAKYHLYSLMVAQYYSKYFRNHEAALDILKKLQSDLELNSKNSTIVSDIVRLEMAHTLARMGKSKESSKLFFAIKQSQKTQVENLLSETGNKKTYTFDSLILRSKLYIKLNDVRSAVELNKKIIDAAIKVFSENHPIVQKSRMQLDETKGLTLPIGLITGLTTASAGYFAEALQNKNAQDVQKWLDSWPNKSFNNLSSNLDEARIQLKQTLADYSDKELKTLLESCPSNEHKDMCTQLTSSIVLAREYADSIDDGAFKVQVTIYDGYF